MTIKIVPATEELIAEVEAWLDAEEAEHQTAKEIWERNGWEGDRPRRGFRCNWDSVKTGWRERGENVDVIQANGKAIGFLNNTHLLEIAPAFRGMGYGALLSDFMLERAFDEGHSFVDIEIAPEEAVGFWKKQGFTIHSDNSSGTLAHKKLDRAFPLGGGRRVSVKIEYYCEDAAYAGRSPFSTFKGEGELLLNGSIQLPERVHGTDYTLRSNDDNHVRIVVEEQQRYFGRARYGTAHGAARDPHWRHYIDRIILADPI